MDNLPELDIEEARSLGEYVADAQFALTQKAYWERRQQGIESLLKPLPSQFEEARANGSQIAQLALEERRRTLIAVLARSLTYSLCPIGVALLAGWHPGWSAALTLPGTAIAVITTKK